VSRPVWVRENPSPTEKNGTDQTGGRTVRRFDRSRGLELPEFVLGPREAPFGSQFDLLGMFGTHWTTDCRLPISDFRLPILEPSGPRHT
jgi:hypothetical protein